MDRSSPEGATSPRARGAGHGQGTVTIRRAVDGTEAASTAEPGLALDDGTDEGLRNAPPDTDARTSAGVREPSATTPDGSRDETSHGGASSAWGRGAEPHPDGAWQRPHRPRIRWVDRPLALVVLGAAILGLALLSMAGAAPSRVTAWWPAAGLAVVALSWAPPDRRRPVALVILLASVIANAVATRSPVMAVGLGGAYTLEAVVVAWWLLRGRPRLYLASLEDLTRLIGATILGVLAMGVTVAALFWAVHGGDGLAAAHTTMTGHAAAILLTVPLAMRTDSAAMPRRRAEAAAQWAATLTVMALVFVPGQSLPVSFLPIPFLVWGALRLSIRTMSAQLAVSAVLISVLTRLHGGPFASELGAMTMPTSSLVQLYLTACALIVLPLTLSVSQRRAVLHRVAASERLFRQSFSEALLGMLVLRRCEPGHPVTVDDADTGVDAEAAAEVPSTSGTGVPEPAERLSEPAGTAPEHAGGGLDVVALNEVAARILNRPEDQLVGSSWTAGLDATDRATLGEAVAAMSDGVLDGWRGELPLRSSEGLRWVEIALSPLSSEAGEGLFVAQMVDVTARRAAEERLTAQALRDSLTGLGNRALLHDRVELALQTLPRGGSGAVLLSCDLDDFTLVNDSTGHGGGDVVLMEVAQRLRALLRPDDVAARLGGDEFVVLRPRASRPEEGEELAAEVLEALSAPLVVGSQPFTIGASIGIAWGRPGDDADELLLQADAAMHAAKGEGKRRAVRFSDEHRARAQRAVRVETDLRRATASDELEIYLQPVVDIVDGRAVAAEALVRWHHPELGVLGPDAWLDVAETSGLMPEIGAWVLRRSCELATSWPVGPDGSAPAVHINVSARQLDVPGFFDTVREVLTSTGLAPDRLVLEFTETQLDDISADLLGELAELRSAGVGLAADDYGTGYSPLTRIIELPLTMVKIDKGFVGAMLEDVRSQAIVTTLVRLSDSLGLDLVAEGVETHEQAAALRLLGCVHGQGYLWSPPVSADEFRESLLDARR